MNSSSIYLDHAAATPLDERVLQAMLPYFSTSFFNPSSPYAPAVDVRRALESERERVARTLGVRSAEIIFTAGATESINLAIAGSMNPTSHAISVPIEHHAVLAPLRRYGHTLVSVGPLGEVNPYEVARAIKDTTTLISIAIANNELGTVQPIRRIAEVVEAERARRRSENILTPIYLHTDASQAAGFLDILPSRLGVDLLTLNASKMYGPKGSGLLWVAAHVTLAPQQLGGGQERGLRSGTENVPAIIGLAHALEHAERHRKSEVKRIAELRDSLEALLRNAFTDIVISRPKHVLPNFLHVSWPGLDAERLVFILEAKGVYVATGSACAANSGTRSHVLTAIGMDPLTADGSLRISLGKDTTEASIATAGQAIIDAVQLEMGRGASR